MVDIFYHIFESALTAIVHDSRPWSNMEVVIRGRLSHHLLLVCWLLRSKVGLDSGYLLLFEILVGSRLQVNHSLLVLGSLLIQIQIQVREDHQLVTAGLRVSVHLSPHASVHLDKVSGLDQQHLGVLGNRLGLVTVNRSERNFCL